MGRMMALVVVGGVRYHPRMTRPMCHLDYCDKPVKGRNLCSGHYAQTLRGETPRPLQYRRPAGMAAPPCEVQHCERPARGLRFCREHKRQLRDQGRVVPPLPSGPNKVVLDGNVARIICLNRYRQVAGVALIDASDLPSASVHRWTINAQGYVRSSTARPTRLHRFLLNPEAGMVVDHINRDPLDNRRSNLRVVTQSANMLNMTTETAGASKFRGVSWSTRRERWRTALVIRGKQRTAGMFDSEMEAAWAISRMRASLCPSSPDARGAIHPELAAWATARGLM